ncbi:hypothetical protein COT07_01010 [Candidatus Woesearchaeota archaeon CG07_land_8_20_14_0_80_44_23]|nr:MAG: hypothetical protein COT07_01010 [Candidatus Woesearchaeota archaeon CG07_land_8_20_14_0_80_44_23]
MKDNSEKGRVRFDECTKAGHPEFIYPEFMIGDIKKVMLKADGSKSLLEVYISSDTQCAYTPRARKALESSANADFINEQLDKIMTGKAYSVNLCKEDSIGTGIRWAAGGALHIDANNTAALIHRDSNAPSYPNHFTLPSGLSANVGEMMNPGALMLRKGLEEIIYLENGSALVPDIADCGCNAESIISEAVKRFCGGVMTYKLKKVDAQLEKDPRWKVITYYNNEELKQFETNAIVCIDPKTAGIDLLSVIRYDADFRKTIPFDTDTYTARNGFPRNLNRKIGLVDVGEMLRGGLVSMECFKGRRLSMQKKVINPTPALQSVMDYLKYE